MRSRRWTLRQLRTAARHVSSYRQLIQRLGLRPAGGNYAQVQKYLRENGISTVHFKGNGWNKGLRGIGKPRRPLEQILTKRSSYQSSKLKKRLFAAGLKVPLCELCGWHERAPDGRVPLELDHVNGMREDNRLENLRILCPNCHSLQGTHRGLNIRRKDR